MFYEGVIKSRNCLEMNKVTPRCHSILSLLLLPESAISEQNLRKLRMTKIQ